MEEAEQFSEIRNRLFEPECETRLAEKFKKMVRMRGPTRKLEIIYCSKGIQHMAISNEEVPIFNMERPKKKIVVTIDSGAAESVTSENHFPKVATRPSIVSRALNARENFGQAFAHDCSDLETADGRRPQAEDEEGD